MGTYVAFFDEIGLDAVTDVGGKGANLGELKKVGLRVPPGFSVKRSAFDAFLESNDLQKPIQKIVSEIDYTNINKVQEKTERIRDMVSQASIPDDISLEITSAYDRFSSNGFPALVAIRSSVATTDLSKSSFPGQMDTYHNVKGKEEVLKLVRQCWGSIWTSRAINTLHAKGIDYRAVIIAPIVQLMISSEIAGVMFTSNPLNGSSNELTIDASFGLGEAVVSDKVTPDNCIVDKNTAEAIQSRPGDKSVKYELDSGKGSGNRWVDLPEEERQKLCLSPEQLGSLWRGPARSFLGEGNKTSFAG
ncbi:MAG: hypothetical protein GY866_38645 [Proteobacteria bacterium]|nr:hypothetical protein [Pseudomonadota bacterium]